MDRIKIFTHTDLDGIGCTVLAYLAFGRDNVDVEYCDYKDVNEKVRNFYLNDKDKLYDAVYITDISVNDQVADAINMIYLLDGRWRLFDHHATALDLNKYKWCDVRVADKYSGIKNSGTDLFYKYLHNRRYFTKYNYRVQSNIARFAEVVRDYDTWRWKEDSDLCYDGNICKQLNDLFHIYGIDKFIEWTLYNILELDAVPYFTEKDRALLEQKQKDIDNYVEIKSKELVTMIDNFGYSFGVVFADRYVSELGNCLSESNPGLEYIAMIDINRGTVSYRTVKDDIDLGGEIAHSFGGGGHRKAAGSTFNADDIKNLVLSEVFGLKGEKL